MVACNRCFYDASVSWFWVISIVILAAPLPFLNLAKIKILLFKFLETIAAFILSARSSNSCFIWQGLVIRRLQIVSVIFLLSTCIHTTFIYFFAVFTWFLRNFLIILEALQLFEVFFFCMSLCMLLATLLGIHVEGFRSILISQFAIFSSSLRLNVTRDISLRILLVGVCGVQTIIK